jgi:hypothetical protein
MCLFIFLHLSNLLIKKNGIAMSIINKKISTILAIDHIYENEFFLNFSGILARLPIGNYCKN